MRTRGTTRRLALGAAALLVAACGTSTTPTVAPSATTAPATQAPGTSPSAEAPSPRPRPSTCSTPATRRPTAPTAAPPSSGTGRRRPVQPVLPDPGHRGQRRRGAWAPLVTLTQRLQVRARPRGADPDDRQRRRQGPGRRRRRDDRHLEAARRPQVVRRRAPHLRRLQVRVGVGPRQGQHRRRDRRLRGHQGLRVPVGHRHGPPLHMRSTRATSPSRSRPLPRHYLGDIPVADQVKGQGFGPRTSRRSRSSGPFKFESVTPQAELRLARNANYTNPATGKPAHLDAYLQVVRRPRRDDRGLPGGRDRPRDRPPGQRHAEGPGPRRRR